MRTIQKAKSLFSQKASFFLFQKAKMENEFLILFLLQALFDLQTIFAYYIKSKEEERHGLSPRMYAALLAVVHQWPFRLDKPFINCACLLQGMTAANHFFTTANSSALEKYTRFDRQTFEALHMSFQVHWRGSMERVPKTRGHLQNRALSSHTALGLVLRWLASGAFFSDLVLTWGITVGTVSRNLFFSLKCLVKSLESCPEAALTISAERLVAIGNQVGDELGEDMHGCCIVIDGSLHLLEQDESAQLNYFYDEKHPDYNGWKGKYCKKGLYFFSFDGLIIWHCVLCPGGWHDGLLFDQASNFLAHLPAGCWILGDSAFPRIEGKVYRCRKDNELLPSDPEKAQKQLAVEALSGKLRLSSEWGIKDLKRVWRIFDNPLPSDSLSTND
jgi:hypothetical protein